MKNFIYLVQGQSDLVKNYLHLADRDNADAIFLTYDMPIKEALYLPKSSFAQGRNKMLEAAIAKGEYNYYIFCDDDVVFEIGGWDEFEKQLMLHKPAVAVPVFWPKTKRTPLKFFKYQTFRYNDEQLMAFHCEVVSDCIVLPYQTQFDDINWWASCEIQQILIQNFYCSDLIQFNNVQISNIVQQRYQAYSEKSEYKKHIRDWLAKQFKGSYKDISMSFKRNFLIILWRTFSFSIRHYRHLRSSSYSVSEKAIKNTLSNDSEMFKQYLERLTLRKDL